MLSGIAKRFGGVSALAGVSLAIRPGEVVGLIGPNGSGKTTLINVVTGFYPPDAGRIGFAGREITRHPPHKIARAGIARTFQTVALIDDLTVLDNVAIGCACGRLGFWRSLVAAPSDPALTAARARAMTLLECMGIAGMAMVNAGSLAYGVRRVVEIARALALRPLLLLLDEPAAGLNETEQADMARRLRALADGGHTLLVVEHNMPFLAPLADRLICLDYGELIAEGAPAEVQAHPKVVEAYLGRNAALV